MTVLLTSVGEKLSSSPPRIMRWLLPLSIAELATGIDARLLGAIMDRESLGGEQLKPKGPMGVGDGGHGRGLMQIDDRYHKSFVGTLMPDGTPAWTHPVENVLRGARILQWNLQHFDGRWPCAVAAYNASPKRVREVAGELHGDALVSAVDAVTTHGNYVSDVLTRARGWGLKI